MTKFRKYLVSIVLPDFEININLSFLLIFKSNSVFSILTNEGLS